MTKTDRPKLKPLIDKIAASVECTSEVPDFDLSLSGLRLRLVGTIQAGAESLGDLMIAFDAASEQIVSNWLDGCKPDDIEVDSIKVGDCDPDLFVVAPTGNGEMALGVGVKVTINTRRVDVQPEPEFDADLGKWVA